MSAAIGGGLELERVREIFITEARELVATLERGALALESTPHDSELLNEVFRAAHSLKGAAAVCGFERVGELTHHLETMLDDWRAGHLKPDHRHFAVMLRAADLLGIMIEDDAANVDTAALRAELEALRGTPAGAAAAHTGHDAEPEAQPSAVHAYSVVFAPQPDAFQFGGDPLLALRELKSLSVAWRVTLDVSRLPALAELNAESSYFGFAIELSLAADVEEARLREALSFFDGFATIDVSKLSAPALNEQQLTAAAATPSTTSAGATDGAGKAAAEASTIRVTTEKVDRIIDLMGELVIAHSAVRELARAASSSQAPALQEAVLLVERHLRELQERVMSVRMVPVSSTFSRLPRMVRDLAKKLDKNVKLEMNGTETELDKTLAEKLGDPLGHLVRNALDHGVETPAERVAAGKPEAALVRVSAYARAGNVFIEVAEDGRGLDRERIRKTAIERGLIGEADELSDDQVFKLICSPGFSTKQTVTDVSGRGVGLDVVQRNLEELGGDLEIESERGRGTCFRLRLPLTLTIIDGLLLSAGAETCVLPLVDIAYSHTLEAGQVQTLVGAGQILDVAGETLPLFDLTQVLGLPARDGVPGSLAVVVHCGAYRYALRVDALLGQVQAVVKSLELHYRRVSGLMGATILGDGRVALILDAQGIALTAGLRRGRVEPNPTRNQEAVAWSPSN